MVYIDRREWSGPVTSDYDRKDNKCLCGIGKKHATQQMATQCNKYHGVSKRKIRRACRILPLLQHFLDDTEESFLKEAKFYTIDSNFISQIVIYQSHPRHSGVPYSFICLLQNGNTISLHHGQYSEWQ